MSSERGVVDERNLKMCYQVCIPLQKIYKEQSGKEAIVQVDHAGLECSVILSKYPNLDVVSLGPTLLSPHTTGERFEIATAEPFWKLLTQVLEEIPAK